MYYSTGYPLPAVRARTLRAGSVRVITDIVVYCESGAVWHALSGSYRCASFNPLLFARTRSRYSSTVTPFSPFPAPTPPRALPLASTQPVKNDRGVSLVGQ